MRRAPKRRSALNYHRITDGDRFARALAAAPRSATPVWQCQLPFCVAAAATLCLHVGRSRMWDNSTSRLVNDSPWWAVQSPRRLEVREKDHPTELARRALWWLIVLVGGRRQQMPAARREHATEVIAL